MGNVLAIVAEYNPFHNGHLYHLEESKKHTDSSSTICIMGGNFTQRGDTSIVDKWSKTRMAISAGVDLVIELPTIYGISSAENFAFGSVRILNNLNIVDYISFGSETGNLEVLDEFATILYREPKEYTTILSHELAKGISYPRARENALLMYLNDIRRYANILSSPNNILGIEYLKALKRLKSDILPLTIGRNAVSYLSDETNGNFASSTAIRQMLQKGEDIKEFVPYTSFEEMDKHKKYGKIVKDISVFEREIIYTFRKMSTEEIADLPDVSEGLENKIKTAASECNTAKDFVNIVKSKRYTETRIKRIMLYALLGITKSTMQTCMKAEPYVRVLGMNDKGKELISRIHSVAPKIPIITSVKDFVDNNKNKNLATMLNIDMLASDIYTMGYEFEPYANLDYRSKLITK